MWTQIHLNQEKKFHLKALIPQVLLKMLCTFDAGGADGELIIVFATSRLLKSLGFYCLNAHFFGEWCRLHFILIIQLGEICNFNRNKIFGLKLVNYSFEIHENAKTWRCYHIVSINSFLEIVERFYYCLFRLNTCTKFVRIPVTMTWTCSRDCLIQFMFSLASLFGISEKHIKCINIAWSHSTHRVLARTWFLQRS